jgi:hypothetical protein
VTEYARGGRQEFAVTVAGGTGLFPSASLWTSTSLFPSAPTTVLGGTAIHGGRVVERARSGFDDETRTGGREI